jgi:hypothetical protein
MSRLRDSFDQPPVRLGPESLPPSLCLPELWKFVLGAKALAAEPDVIVWSIAVQDLAAGHHRDEVFRRAAFLFQACRARDIVPLVVTPPPMRDIEREEGRIAALRLKRFALRNGLPVCDAYSQAHALTTKDGGAPFADLAKGGGANIGVAGLNDQGRNWFADMLERTLARHRK